MIKEISWETNGKGDKKNAMNFQFLKGFKNCFIKTMTENRKTEALIFEAKEMHNFLFAILQLVNLISFLF